MPISAEQVRMARALLRWSVRELAKRAKVAPGTIVRIEAKFAAKPTTLKAVEGALRRGGAAFSRAGGVKARRP